MSRPQDPAAHPNAGAYDQTRIGVPRPGPPPEPGSGPSGFSPVPDSQPAVAPAPAPHRPLQGAPAPAAQHPPAAQYPPANQYPPAAPYPGGPDPRVPQTPVQRSPAPQAPVPYGASPYAPAAGPVPPGGYGVPNPYPPLPPQRSRSAAVAGVVVLIAVAGVVAGLLVWQPWSSDSGGGQRTQTFALDHDYQARVQIPAGWRGFDDSSEGVRGPVIVPRDDRRAYSQITGDLDRIDDGQSVQPVHVISVTAQTCTAADTSSTPGQWKWETRELGDRQITAASGVSRLDADVCLVAIAVDADTGSAAPQTTAQDLARELVAKNRLSAAKAT